MNENYESVHESGQEKLVHSKDSIKILNYKYLYLYFFI